MVAKVQIAIDGPAGSGKSTVARLVAKELCYRYVDTGAWYRAVTLIALRQGINFDNQPALNRLAKTMLLEVKTKGDGWPLYLLAGKDISAALRSPQVDDKVSQVAKIITVRDQVSEKLRAIGNQKGVVMDGRDIGTVVLPDAEVKVFLTADLATRAKRRKRELESRGFSLPLSAVKEEICQRDEKDSSREVAPLMPAADAYIIDTTNLTVDEVVASIVALVRGME
ncbi:MAG TPA: (d)CMP kinase [bacterium]|jgi:cytidylate kinase|nr:(d)CMP kinase [bacterium]